jgi:sarcosine/dimethylglycine N-methyltransferase
MESHVNDAGSATGDALPGPGLTESDIGSWHDRTDERYREFWGESDHWGVFESFVDDPALFEPACRRTDETLLAAAGLDAGDRVLDVGCGGGTTARWLAATVNCHVYGIDLSEVKVDRARKAAAADPRCQFRVASAAGLIFGDGDFTAAWSQAAMYQMLDRTAVLREIYRVLRPGGRLVFDDLTTPAPRKEVTAQGDSMRWVYDRLLFRPTWSLPEYRDQLSAAGFVVREAVDLTPHLRWSYHLLEQRARGVDPELPRAYAETVSAIDRGHLGWARFTAVVPG